MAEDWIKVQVMLAQSPRLIELAGWLSAREDFRAWLFPGGQCQRRK